MIYNWQLWDNFEAAAKESELILANRELQLLAQEEKDMD